jgi:hypothetical protein
VAGGADVRASISGTDTVTRTRKPIYTTCRDSPFWGHPGLGVGLFAQVTAPVAD